MNRRTKSILISIFAVVALAFVLEYQNCSPMGASQLNFGSTGSNLTVGAIVLPATSFVAGATFGASSTVTTPDPNSTNCLFTILNSSGQLLASSNPIQATASGSNNNSAMCSTSITLPNSSGTFTLNLQVTDTSSGQTGTTSTSITVGTGTSGQYPAGAVCASETVSGSSCPNTIGCDSLCADWTTDQQRGLPSDYLASSIPMGNNQISCSYKCN